MTSEKGHEKMLPMSRSNELRGTFDGAAEVYEAARPDYPADLYRDLIELSGIDPGANLLEIGCGSGKATRPLAEQGFRILCIELGERLAEVARKNLTAYPGVDVVTSSFENWNAGDRRFDLAYAATSWHWIDREIRYVKAASLLKPGGHLAFWSATHAFPAGFDSFFTEIQEVYEAIGERYEGTWPPPPPEKIPDQTAEIEASGLFDVIGVRRFVWAQTYTAEEYIALLETFSGHRAMTEANREVLYREIRDRIGRRAEERVIRHWRSILHVARLRSDD